MKKAKRRLNIVSLLCVLLALVLVGLYFMPLWSIAEYSATKEEEYAVSTLFAGDDSAEHFEVKDLVRPSLFTYTKVYHYYGEELYKNEADPSKDALISKLCMMGPAITSIVVLLLAFVKLPWLMLLFEAASALVYFFDVKYIDVASKISSDSCTPGIAYKACPYCFAVLAVFTILMIIFKGVWKRARKKEKMEVYHD